MTRVAELTWQQAGQVRDALLVVPLGATEQHGPHLPLSTDTDIAVALAERLAGTRPGIVVGPAVPYGASGEHAGFAGTLSVGQHALELLLVELVRSATDSWPRVLLLSAHGGNAAPVRRAVARLRAEQRTVWAWSPAWPGDAHAGHTETSVQLALSPTQVRRADSAVGAVAPLEQLMPRLRTGGVAAVSPNGVLGDPTGASAEHGEDLLHRAVRELAAWLDSRELHG